MTSDERERLNFLSDRVAVLEQLVAALLRQEKEDNIPEKLVSDWKAHVANWPDVAGSLTADTIRLVETTEALSRRKRNGL
ncbi:hypothetical protein NKI89_10245 [Mesorhizobium sp. M0309]|uniref:hypothetical protein n=1 Tax=Mesorhizobium sp. M0309 TaxID=2956933 RepID=UPI00333D3274